MRKHIAGILILVMLLSTGCQPVGPVSTDPSGPAMSNTNPTATKPAEPKPTEPTPTDPAPTDPAPTETQPTEPKPTEPLPTEPEPTQPKPEIPEGFPDDIDTDPTTVAVFQELFADDTWYAQALGHPFDDPAKAHIAYLFGGFGFEDEPPITEEERAEIVKLSNYKDYEWMPGYRLPVDKMNAVLRTLFGLTLEDMDLSTAVLLEYLESTNCYYRLGSDSAWSGCFEIVGTKNLDNGNIEVYYYRNMGVFDEEDRPRGVAVLKPVEDGYHIVANDNNFYYWNENFHPWLT